MMTSLNYSQEKKLLTMKEMPNVKNSHRNEFYPTFVQSNATKMQYLISLHL